ncbi:MAG: YhdP family protein [Steroidobacter sp.]
MKSRNRKLLRWLLGSFVGAVVLTGLLLAAFGFVVTRVPEYRVQVQDWINERSGLVVEFSNLSARLKLYGPELVFDAAVVRTPDRTRVLATATRGSVGFDVWAAIGEGRLSAGRFSLESPQIGLIRTKEGRIQLLGQSALPERLDAKPFALEQLPTGRFDVDNAVVTFRDEITGRGPWSLSGVNFELLRDESNLRLRGDASLPESLGADLQFTATAHGPLEQYSTLVSTFSVESDRLDLAGWADVLPDEWPAPETGYGSLTIHGAVLGPALTQLSARIDLSNVAAAAPVWSIALPSAAPMQQPRPSEDDSERTAVQKSDSTAAEPQAPAAILSEMVSYDRIAFDLQAQRLGDEWSASLTDLDLARKDAAWRASQIRAKWTPGDGGRVLKASGTADRIVLESLWPLLAYLPESESLARLRALNARGVLQNVSASYERSDQNAAKYQFNTRLNDIAFEPIEKAPGLAGLSGEIAATQDGGRWRIAQNEVRFTLPRWFREPLAAQVTGGEVGWRAQDSGWIVNGEDLRVQSEDGRAVGRFSATFAGDDSSPVLDLSAQAQDLVVSATRNYVPAGRLGARTVEWFDQAFLDGRVVAADVVYKGPVRSFPFRNGEGEFRARAQVQDAAFSYHPGWTPASGVEADLEFHNEGLHVRASGANVGALHVSEATADVEDLKQAVLVIKATGRGELQDGLRMLKDSPLGPKLGEQFARLNGSGAMQTDLRLHLPIRQMANRDIEVTTRLTNATAWLQDFDAPVKKLTGALTVRNTSISSADMQGQWLGGPISVSVTPDGAASSALVAQGRSAAAQVKPLLGLPSSVGLRGVADWRVTTTLTAAGVNAGAPQVMRIESDTKGLGVGLPAPLGKTEDEVRDLRLALEFDPEQNLLVRGSFGEVRSLVRMRQSADGWTLDRGGLRADGVTPSLPDHRGLRIEGSIDRFVLDEWLALKGSGGGKPLSEYLQAANVRVGEFVLFGYRWPDLRGVLQATQAGWRVDVSGEHAAGQILIPQNLLGEQPLRATMERLVIAKAPGRPVSDGVARDPRNLPGLQVYVSDLRIGARTIGAVDLKASRVPQGIRFDSATVMSESIRAEGRGHWFNTADGQQSSLDARVISDDVAGALRALNYTGFLEAKHGEIRADLSWPGGFSGDMLEHASGALSVTAEAGQLVNLQPGAGRVLGLFSIAALPRRLSLDFSDLTEKGLAFDVVHGDFELRDGNAYTNNLLLRGPAAEIGIAGRTGLGARDYDQTAVVTGNLGASLPVAGALAGGPAVGAALLLFSQVFKEPLKGITRGYYRITGPWDNPIVERIDASEASAKAEGDT